MQRSNFVKTHLPCPCKESSDAYSLNSDGSGFCFSCSKYFKNNKEVMTEGKVTARYMSHFGVSEATNRFYDVKTKLVDGVPQEIGYPYSTGGLKIRSLETKSFRAEGNMKAPGLFGKDKFDPGSKPSITITEGEKDATSVYEVTGGKTAAVSVTSATMAMRDCIQDRDYINSFDKIILFFDNDDPGQKALRQVSALFDFNKVYIVKTVKYKDANDYLQAGEPEDLQKVWAAARRYSPDNIISTFAEIEAALGESKEDQIGTYPFSSLQTSTYGLHKGEVIVVKAKTHVGKTEFFRALEHHLLKTTDKNLGIIHLEEDNQTTIKALAGYELNVDAVVPDSGLSLTDIFEGYKKAVNFDDKRVHLYNSFELEDENIILDNIRFLASAAGCEFIFLDHITWLATGLQQEDERLRLDRLSQKLKLLAKELRICLVMISHCNDDGRTRGSRNIENVANTMIHLSRDHTSADENQRRIVNFMVEKARLGGHTGPAGHAIKDSMTGKLRETKQEDFIEMPLF